MYRHLLVPVDATDLSIEVVASAVDFAASAGARVTFFHAVPGHAASPLGESLRVTSPQASAYGVQGRALELLAKAEAAARAWGVPCDSIHTVSDMPASAIIVAARSLGCDLIFMASHGSRNKLGMALASETVDVLMHAGLPVLVAATGELQPPARAIAIIRDEHRALSAVLHSGRQLLAMQGPGGLNREAMREVVRYVDRFETRHHTKEGCLFQRLRTRTSFVDGELNELERQNDRARQLVTDIALQMETIEAAGGDQERERTIHSLERALTAYANFVWDHMGREEAVVLPAARRFLEAADWLELDTEMSRDGGGDEEDRSLFARIVDRAQRGPAA